MRCGTRCSGATGGATTAGRSGQCGCGSTCAMPVSMRSGSARGSRAGPHPLTGQSRTDSARCGAALAHHPAPLQHWRGGVGLAPLWSPAQCGGTGISAAAGMTEGWRGRGQGAHKGRPYRVGPRLPSPRPSPPGRGRWIAAFAAMTVVARVSFRGDGDWCRSLGRVGRGQ